MYRLSYKLTHLYYNWPGTVRVPAPCQVRQTWNQTHRLWNSHSGLKVFPDSCIPTIFSATLTPFKYAIETSDSCKQSLFRSISFRVSFQSDISITVYMISNRHFHSGSNIHCLIWNEKMNSIWNGSIRIQVNKYDSTPCGLNRNGMNSVRVVTQSGFM